MGARAVTVRGGSNGIEAHSQEMMAVAHALARAARDFGVQSLHLHACLLDPPLLASAALDPGGAARFELALLAALDGRHGLTWLAADCELLDSGLRGAVAIYRCADEVDARIVPALRGVVELPVGVRHALPALDQGHFGTAINEFLSTDPYLGDAVIDLVTDFWRNQALTNAVAVWPDGRPQVNARADDDSPTGRNPPRNLRDVMAALAVRNNAATTGGDIDVRIITTAMPSGQSVRHVIVDIPGTKNWSPLPGRDVTSLGTNARGLAGATTTYELGVLEAMRQAGVSADDDVMLVGHSEGGMIAINAARDAVVSGAFHVSHVVTAGSPIGRLSVPPSVQVLAQENEGDVIPHCDGALNTDRTNITTVTVHRNHRDVLDNHDIEKSYLPGTDDIDASTDPSIRDYLSALDGFLGGDRVQTKVFHVTRH
jgi:hypothetical protein